jgi:peptide/nickel transport system ATP-binding protein
VTHEQPLLEARELAIEYGTHGERVRALDAANLAVRSGEITALVGESGSGKTTLGTAAGRMLAANAEHVGGELRVAGHRVLDCDAETLRAVRRDVLGFVFQNPVSALNPTMRVGRQMELATAHREVGQTPREALEQVGMRDSSRVLRSYPHELSGGMAQRVGIAIALSRQPQLLIADEPTAAVDASLRPQILELLTERSRAERSALLLLTHDLHAVARYCSRITVMYGGRVVEDGPTAAVLSDPKHPYTRALIAALPGEERPGERLQGIPGTPPVLHGPHPGCAFVARCSARMPTCTSVRPISHMVDDRAVSCHLFTSGQSHNELVHDVDERPHRTNA